MADRERTAVRRLLMLGVLAVGAAAATSVGLDRSAAEAAAAGRARGWTRTLAQLARMAEGPTAAHGDGDLGALISVVTRTEPGLSFLRVEGGDGRVLGQAGDEAQARRWEDRTFGLERGAVRVRVGYRTDPNALAVAVRAVLWASLTGGAWAAGAAVVAWTLRRRETSR